MDDEGLRARVRRCLKISAGHPAWWVVALFTTLVVDRPLQFLFASQFLTGREDVFPSITELTSQRESLLSLFIAVSALLLIAGKALDYWSQSTLIVLADGEAGETAPVIPAALRRGWKALARYAAAVLPVDLARYLLWLLPGLLWLILRAVDPGGDQWCTYSIFTLAWLFTCVPLAVALGVFSELAGREVVLGASGPPAAWLSAWTLGRDNRREVFEAWLPTLAADLVVAVIIGVVSFAGAYLLFVTRTGLGLEGVVWDLISTASFVLTFTAVKAAHAVAQTFKSVLWTLTYRDLSESVLN